MAEGDVFSQIVASAGTRRPASGVEEIITHIVWNCTSSGQRVRLTDGTNILEILGGGFVLTTAGGMGESTTVFQQTYDTRIVVHNSLYLYAHDKAVAVGGVEVG